MFRRVQPISHKEEEIVFPVDMEKLGLFVNEDDELRQIHNPEERFNYFRFKVERLNERRRESLNECIRRIIKGRLEALGMKIQMLPLEEDDTSGRKVPVYVSDDLATNKDKTLIIIPDSAYDFGIWSYRVLEDQTLEKGSMVYTVKKAKEAGFSVVIMNVAQNIWSPYHDPPQAVTYTSWKATTKNTPNIDEVKNRVPHNETARAHVHYVMEKIVKRNVPKETNVYMLTAGFGAMGTVTYFNKTFAEWKDRLQAVVFCETPHATADIVDKDFEKFIRERCRCYIIYAHAKGEYIQDRRYGCHTFSSGEMFTDCVVPAVQDLVFSYFKAVEENPDIANPQLMTAAALNDAGSETEEAINEAILNEEWISPGDPGPWKVDVQDLKKGGENANGAGTDAVPSVVSNGVPNGAATDHDTEKQAEELQS